MGIYNCAGLTAQLSIIMPAQIRKYNTKTLQVHHNKTPKRQNNNDMAGKSQYKRGTWTKTLSP